MSKQIVRCKLCGAKMRGGGEYLYSCKGCGIFVDQHGVQWKQVRRRTSRYFATAVWEPIDHDPLEVWRETVEGLDIGEGF